MHKIIPLTTFVTEKNGNKGSGMRLRQLLLLTGLLLFCSGQIGAQTTRSLWVTRWDYKTPQDIKNIIDNAVTYHFNTLLFQVRGNATVFYPSDIEPWAEEFNFENPGWDPLQLAIELAHNRGLALHAWVNVYPGWRGDSPPDIKNQLYHRHRDWFMQDKYGDRQNLNDHYLWLSPTHPQTPDYLLNLMREIYSTYDIDGLHLDYIRFPSSSYSWDNASLKMFKIAFGGLPKDQPDKWDIWRRHSITNFITDLYGQLKACNPQTILSASVVSDYRRGYHLYMQDSHGWLSKGVMDIIYPMIYTKDHLLFYRQLKDHRKNNHNRDVYPGIFAHDAKKLSMQIRIAEKMACGGVSVFAYSKLFPAHTPDTAFSQTLINLWPTTATPRSLNWKSVHHDTQGPLITQVHTVPVNIYKNNSFKIVAKITDPSGVYDDKTTAQGKGVYLRYASTSSSTPDIIGMRRMSKESDWFITEKSIPPQKSGLDFRCRIFAWDDFKVSAGHSKRNMGYSDVWSLDILEPNESYINQGEFGDQLWNPSALQVDPYGKIWVIAGKKNTITVLNPDGSESDLSDVQNPDNSALRELEGLTGLAYSPRDIMCAVKDSTIFRINVKSGDLLKPVKLNFATTAIDCDAEGHIFALEKTFSQFHVLAPTGAELQNSPFGIDHSANHITVFDNAMMVLISDRSTDSIQCWKGAIEGRRARYWRADNLQTFDIDIGKVVTDKNGRIYIPHSPRGLISIMDRSGRVLEYLKGGKPPLRTPRTVGISPSRDSLYVLEAAGYGPIKLYLWTKSPKFGFFAPKAVNRAAP